jgi:hypothetical protein
MRISRLKACSIVAWGKALNIPHIFDSPVMRDKPEAFQQVAGG